ncbi:SDR family NAD(P)-dependent oxidoreductase [Gryllotalpicola reticulitermitis]|uniref:SDR family NAD(P)-dependent oxidoreductase n=1 Tax=Gryllotalpicola reticulitermitis TaxID=1184153 RepID=A0ABV8Q491_9MICO
MSGRAEGKVVLVTGTGGDIARAAAITLAREGAHVVGCDINVELAEETVAAVRDAGGSMDSLHPLDLSVEGDAQRWVEFALARHGRIDAIVNNAKAARGGSGEETSAEDWRFTIDRNLTLPWLVTKAAIPALKESQGSVLFIASVSGAQFGTGYPGNTTNLVAYSTAKAGILRLSVALANELGAAGVRVNTLSPGIVETASTLRSYGLPGTPRRELVSRPALLPQRTGHPQDIANAVLFLVSDDASWITGADLRVDGGWAASGGVGPMTSGDAETLASRA